MNANGFREDELVTRKIKVGNEWQTRTFPIIGGRLRLVHEDNQSLNLQTEMVNWDGQYAVFKCCAVTGKGQFIGYGTANSQRDARLAESLIELAETRSIARALRFAGYGLEFCSAEEISVVPESEALPERTTGESAGRVSLEGNGDGKEEAKSQDSRGNGQDRGNVNPPNGGRGRATSAQVRALFALTKRAQYGDEDVRNLLAPLNAASFQDLSREDASRLISALQTEAAA